jgi:plasmid stabilization system protein ParE
MAYRVKIHARAKRDLAAIYRQIRAEHSDPAFLWFLGLKQAMRSLAENPRRCPVTPEDPGLRHLLYGRSLNVYRVIYQIFERPARVEIIHIRHGAQQPFTAADLN